MGPPTEGRVYAPSRKSEVAMPRDCVRARLCRGYFDGSCSNKLRFVTRIEKPRRPQLGRD
jgi:hypothetical protein